VVNEKDRVQKKTNIFSVQLDKNPKKNSVNIKVSNVVVNQKSFSFAAAG